VADLARLKDPADPAYRCGPARFLRVTRAVAPPASSMGLRRVIGETDFEQQQILGYVPIEPDGSVKFEVPADTPLAWPWSTPRAGPSRRTPTGCRCALANAAPATAATARGAGRR
jgi:hypothetical protein